MLISVFKNHENSSPSVVLLTGYSDDLSVNSIKRGIYLTNVYYQKIENKTIVYVKSSAYVYISTLCIGMNGSLKLSHENNLDLPSDAIEIPISWQEFSNIWELEGLLEINKIINGFTSESFSLHKGESKRIKANGILVICSQYYNLYPSIAVISPATKNIEYIGGYKEYIDGTLFTFTFENDYTTIMTSKIEGVEGSRVPFLIAYQNLLPYISRKTKCSAFTKHFVPESHLLTQIKMWFKSELNVVLINIYYLCTTHGDVVYQDKGGTGKLEPPFFYK